MSGDAPSGEPDWTVIRIGAWTAEGVQRWVWIVRQDRDFYHEEFYDEPPDLTEDGQAFYVLYGDSPDPSKHSSRSATCLSLEEAVRKAETSAPGLRWLDAAVG